MSLKFHDAILLAFGLALPLGACSERSHTAARSPHDTLHNGMPDGDHTMSRPNTAADDTAGDEVSKGTGNAAPGGSDRPGPASGSPDGS
jgi:hypothetical protein